MRVPDQCLAIMGAGAKLFCTACCEELTLKRMSLLATLLLPSTNLERTGLLLYREARESDITNLLQQGDVVQPIEETLPMDQRVYSIRVMKCFLRAAIPLTKLDFFRELLEEDRFRLSDRRHMSNLVPLIVSQEQENMYIKSEVSGRPLSVVFDGMTRVGEAMAVVVRYINNSFSIQQRLIRLQLLTKNMMGEEIVREIINALFVHYSIGSNLIMALMHDKAARNTVALRTLKVVYPILVDVGCFSHTHDLVREKFCIPSFPLSLFGGLVCTLTPQS